jgi:type IV pilus assembly protein PilY1
MRPSVAHAPGSGFLILFGTGKYLAAADARPGASGIQSFYAIHDSLADDYTVQGRNDLAVRTLVRDGAAAYRIAGNAFTYGSGKSDARGWYVDFDAAGQTGERVVSDASLHSGFLIFHSLIPASDLCAPAAGRNYVLDVLTGMPASARSTGVALSPGMSMQPVILDTAAGVRSVSPIGRRTETRRLTVLGAGPGGVRQIDTIDIVRYAGRLSWREILNWQELRHDAIKHE